MLIGVPKESKSHKRTVGMTSVSEHEVVHHSYGVIVETSADRTGVTAT